eukprot:TRINITY_DN23020_c0_g1_i1.p1 TRINITY_DN23020_c0_g1~~TRINITY_DN23020_c0_g1_i1.p1  ORF type:complete len:478 (-),score=84.28 TRINITY_DN23020_c0_g1_i1:21-1454(-)
MNLADEDLDEDHRNDHMPMAETGEELDGNIKMFMHDKGFGFILCEDVEKDVYVNRREMPPPDGRDPKGRRVTFKLVRTKDGQPQARAVQYVFDDDGDELLETSGDFNNLAFIDEELDADSGRRTRFPDRLEGSVKSFMASKGYGFIGCDSVEKDVFFKREMLPAEMMQEFSMFGKSLIDLVGRRVSFKMTRAQDGKPQAQSILLLGVPMLGKIEKYSTGNMYGFVVSSSLDIELQKNNLYFNDRELPLQAKELVAPGMIVKFEIDLMPGDPPKQKAARLVFHPEQLALQQFAVHVQTGLHPPMMGGFAPELAPEASPALSATADLSFDELVKLCKQAAKRGLPPPGTIGKDPARYSAKHLKEYLVRHGILQGADGDSLPQHPLQHLDQTERRLPQRPSLPAHPPSAYAPCAFASTSARPSPVAYPSRLMPTPTTRELPRARARPTVAQHLSHKPTVAQHLSYGPTVASRLRARSRSR